MFAKQNDKEFLALLVAMRFYYNKAKTIHRYRVTGNILMALIAGIMVSMFPQIKEFSFGLLPVIGFIWLLFSRLILQETEKKYTKIGATIQEEFDTSLFGIPWHKSLVGNKVQPEFIKLAERKFKGDRDKLKNWYVGLNASDKTLNVLLAQRMSLVWDTNLRKRYALLVACITFLYFICTILLGLKTDMGSYILTLLIPSAAILLHGIETCRDHYKRAKGCDQLGRDVLSTFNTNIGNSDPDVLKKCREYQDYIFQRRCDITLVPNMLYWLSRNEDDQTMKLVNEDLSQY